MSILADFPIWSIYAIVGALLGGVFAIAGHFASRFIGVARFLPVLAIALTPVLSREFVIPAIVYAKMNEGLPRSIDEVTVLERVEREESAYRYFYKLDDSLAGADINQLKAINLAQICLFWGPNFKSGEATKAEYIYSVAGSSMSFSVDQSDCT